VAEVGGLVPHRTPFLSNVSPAISQGTKRANANAYMAPSAGQAKVVADQEIAKYGHVCTEACKGWVQVH
jgi:hypothetical protein